MNTAKIRAKAFGRMETITVSVDEDGTVRVWDEVAGYYTTCHSLSAAAMRRARAAIAEATN